jgi:DGQHR domain-containing protein
MIQSLPTVNLEAKNGQGRRSLANIVTVASQGEALQQAFAHASTSGARSFMCHVYQQGGRYHLVFSLPMAQLVELAKLQSAEAKRNKADAETKINRPLMPQHRNEIAKYLMETDNYILPPFIFNCDTPIKVFAYGEGPVLNGYAIIPNGVDLYVTDGQHRLEAIKKVLPEKPELKNDSVTVLVVQEEDIEQIHQDFADCAKNKPIPPALLAVFDVSDSLAKLTRQLSKELVIFDGRIDKISRSVGKDKGYMFTMNQLKVGISEFLFGASQKQNKEVIYKSGEYKEVLERAKAFYTLFAENNNTWQLLMKPAEETQHLDLYFLRQQRIDFTTVGFQVISRIGHYIYFGEDFTPEQRNILVKALASLDYNRDAELWQNTLVMDDGEGGKKIIIQISAVKKAVKVVINAIRQITEINLL